MDSSIPGLESVLTVIPAFKRLRVQLWKEQVGKLILSVALVSKKKKML